MLWWFMAGMGVTAAVAWAWYFWLMWKATFRD
jgi:hypothetical protein